MATRTLQDIDDNHNVVEFTTEFPPPHLRVEFQSFSKIPKTGYESTEFRISDKKWKMLIYPNGKECTDVGDHVSVYLSLSESYIITWDYTVNVALGIFMYNHKSNEYTCKQVRNFQFTTSKRNPRAWGFPKLISKKRLIHDGFLVDDMCIFGAEVFVFPTPTPGIDEIILKTTAPYVHIWNITNIKTRSAHTTSFRAQNIQWGATFYPRALPVPPYITISLSTDLGLFNRVEGECIIRIKNQKNDKHVVATAKGLFQKWYFTEYDTEIARVKDLKNGFIVNDSCIIEIEIKVTAIVRGMSINY